MISEKMVKIQELIGEISKENEVIGAILLEGFGMSINLIRQKIDNPEAKSIDVSEQIQVVSSILGFSLEEMVTSILETKSAQSDKPADADTLEFITSSVELDDYEKFLAQNKAKESLDFLSKEI